MTKPSMTLRQIEQAFDTEEKCKTFLVSMRWPDGKAVCPRCGQTERVYALKTRPFHWVCKNPSEECPGVYRFSVLTGTIFENTNVPLRTWFRVLYLMTQSKKGISALQVHRMIDPVRGSTGSYRTAWYMCHRIRAAMVDSGFLKLTGVVEVDETYIGGKNKNRHGGGKGMLKRTGKKHIPRDDKVPVIGAISRKGNVTCRVLERVTAQKMTGFVQQAVSSKVELVATDEHRCYELTDIGFRHETVNHSESEYVRGVVHTANLDSFWSPLKRGVMGTFHPCVPPLPAAVPQRVFLPAQQPRQRGHLQRGAVRMLRTPPLGKRRPPTRGQEVG